MKLQYLFGMILLPGMMLGQVNKSASNIIVVNDDITLGYTRPRITVVDNNIPVVIWGNKNDYDLHVSRKVSSSFSTGVKLNPTGMTVSNSNWEGPELASYGDDLFVTFKALPEKSSLIYVLKSSDGGQTFDDTVRVSNNNWTRFPSCAVDPNGKPYVAFMEFDSNFIDPHYSVATSSDFGQSFNPSVIGTGLAPGEVCDCCPSFIMADLNRVSLLFRNNDNNLRDLWASISTNSAVSFPTASDIDNNNWMINICPSTGPDALSIGDSLLAVWMSGASNASRINIGTADFQSLSIGLNAELHNNIPATANQNYPKIAGEKDTLAVVWQESYQGHSYIKGVFSVSGISGLLSAVVDTINDIASFYQVNPDIAYQDGIFHITWQNNNQREVLYRSIGLREITGIDAPLIAEKLSIHPNPVNGLLIVEVPASFHHGRLTISNILGEQVFELDAIKKGKFNIPLNLPSGIYMLSINNSTSLITERLVVK